MRSSVGWIVMLLLHGAIFPPVALIDFEFLFLEQDIEPGSSAYTDNTSSYCVHAPLVTSTLQALHTRA